MLSPWLYRCCRILLFISTYSAAISATASIQIFATRLMFEEHKKEAAVRIENTSSDAVLIQTWLEHNAKDVEKNTPLPFFVTPPLSRLEGAQQNTLRVRRTGVLLPTDRESVFWLNIKEIPQVVKADNVLQLAINTRIKLFFRPTTLSVCGKDAYTKLHWAVLKKEKNVILEANNPTPCFITIASLTVNEQEKVTITGVQMIAPFDKVAYNLMHKEAAEVKYISYQTINEYGGETNPLKHVPSY